MCTCERPLLLQRVGGLRLLSAFNVDVVDGPVFRKSRFVYTGHGPGRLDGLWLLVAKPLVKLISGTLKCWKIEHKSPPVGFQVFKYIV